jgi:hypothetical protein
MIDLIGEASALGILLEETRGVVGVVLGTPDGELRTVVGSFVDGDATAASAASLTEELGRIGELLGLGELGVASLKAMSAARVFARQADTVLAIELDPKRPLGELETKLRTVSWAPPPDDPNGPAVHRVPTVNSFEARAEPTTVVEPAGDGAPAAAANSALSNDYPTPISIPLSALQSATQRSRNTRPSQPPPPPAAAMRPAPPSAPPRPPGASVAPRPLIGPARTKPPTPPIVSGRSPTPTGAGIRPSSLASLPVQVKAVAGGPVFTGDLEEFALPDLLEFLRNSHRSGLLMCTTAAGVGTIQLSRGMIISADSPSAIVLRQHLLASAELAPERRRALAELPAESFNDDMIDAALVARDLVPPEELERARVLRIYSALREMIRWTVGRFSFDPGVAVVTNPRLALSAQTILMHLYQEQDEKAR